MDEEMKDLKNKVGKIEKFIWVACVVAVIFGVAGGWGYKAISKANKLIDDLNSRIGDTFQMIAKIEKARDQAIRDMETAAPSILEKARLNFNIVKSDLMNGECAATGQTFRYVSVNGKDLEVSINTNGRRPVFVGIEMFALSHVGTLEIVRKTVGQGDAVVGRTLWVHNNALPASPWCIDTPPKGTFIYKVRFNGMTDNETGRTIGGRLVAFEL